MQYFPKRQTICLRELKLKPLNRDFAMRSYLLIHPSTSPGVQPEREQRALLSPVSRGPAAGQPGLPTGRTGARLHRCDADERRRHAVDEDRMYQRSSSAGPPSQHTWIVLAEQRAEGVVTSACALFFFLWIIFSLFLSLLSSLFELS